MNHAWPSNSIASLASYNIYRSGNRFCNYGTTDHKNHRDLPQSDGNNLLWIFKVRVHRIQSTVFHRDFNLRVAMTTNPRELPSVPSLLRRSAHPRRRFPILSHLRRRFSIPLVALSGVLHSWSKFHFIAYWVSERVTETTVVAVYIGMDEGSYGISVIYFKNIISSVDCVWNCDQGSASRVLFTVNHNRIRTKGRGCMRWGARKIIVQPAAAIRVRSLRSDCFSPLGRIIWPYSFWADLAFLGSFWTYSH